MIQADKLQRFQLYQQKMLANVNSWLEKMFYPNKNVIEKAPTMKKKIECFPLGKELKAETDIAKKTVSKITPYL